MASAAEAVANGEPIIRIRDVRKAFVHGRVQALNGVSLDVYPRQVVVIIGPSGSGKSTLLRCINHLEVPESGSVVVDGVPLTAADNINRVRMEVGMVFQQFNLFPHLTVMDNLTLAQRIVRKRSRAEATAIALDLLAKVGIPDKATAYPGQLSGGQQQRVAVARALMNDPFLLLADEPTGNLDSHSGQALIELLEQLNRDRGLTIIVVTHDPDISSRARRVIHMQDGALVADERRN